MRIKVSNQGMAVLDIGNLLDGETDKQFAHGVAATRDFGSGWSAGARNPIHSHDVWNVVNAAVGMELDELDFKLPTSLEGAQAGALADLMTDYLRHSGYPMLPKVPALAVGLCLKWGWISLPGSPEQPKIYQVWHNGEHFKDVNNPDWEPGPGIHFPGEKPMYGQCVELVDPIEGEVLKSWDWHQGMWHLTHWKGEA